MDKKQLRENAQQILKAIPAETRARLSRQIRGHLEALIREGSHHTVAAYAAMPGEVDLDPLFRDLPIQWALPRMTAAGIEMRIIDSPDDLVPGMLRIREPDPRRCPRISALEADLILVPGLAFSIADSGRLGRGKGHYDRFLSALAGAERPPLLCGICFAAQLRDTLPLEAHDFRMDAIVTEDGLTRRQR